jgi:hypothetical protein
MASERRATQRRNTRGAAKKETAAARKKREAAEREAATEPQEGAEVVELPTPPQDDQQLNAVVVHRVFTEQGVQTMIQTSGDVRITEVEHVLKSALKQVKEQFGFDD